MATTIRCHHGSDRWTTNQHSLGRRSTTRSKDLSQPRLQVFGIKVTRLSHNPWPQAKQRTEVDLAGLYPKTSSSELEFLFGLHPDFVSLKLDIPPRPVIFESLQGTVYDVQPTDLHKKATPLIAPTDTFGVIARQLPTHNSIQSVDLEDDVKHTPKQPQYLHDLPIRSRIAKSASCPDVNTASQQLPPLETCVEQTRTKSRSSSPNSIAQPKIQALADHPTYDYHGESQGWSTGGQGQPSDDSQSQGGNNFFSGGGGGFGAGNDGGPDRRENEGDGGDQQDGGAEQGDPEQLQDSMLACLHWAFDPIEYRDCNPRRFKAYPQVRNHAKKHHHQSHNVPAAQCTRCKRLFSDKDECKQHKQARSCQETEGLIFRKATDLEKWKLTFEFFFPGAEVPMPWIWGHVARLNEAKSRRLIGTSEQENADLREKNARLEEQVTAMRIGAEAMELNFSSAAVDIMRRCLQRENIQVHSYLADDIGHQLNKWMTDMLKKHDILDKNRVPSDEALLFGPEVFVRTRSGNEQDPFNSSETPSLPHTSMPSFYFMGTSIQPTPVISRPDMLGLPMEASYDVSAGPFYNVAFDASTAYNSYSEDHPCAEAYTQAQPHDSTYGSNPNRSRNYQSDLDMDI